MYVFVLTAVILFQEQICCCSTPGQDRRTESGDTKGSGLVGGHAYSLLDAREVFGHKLVRVRNPGEALNGMVTGVIILLCGLPSLNKL